MGADSGTWRPLLTRVSLGHTTATRLIQPRDSSRALEGRERKSQPVAMSPEGNEDTLSTEKYCVEMP